MAESLLSTPPETAAPSESLLANREMYERLVAMAIRGFGENRPDAAATFCQLAATWAWQNPCGVFADPRLEAVLAASAPPAERAQRPWSAPDRPRKVLHVLTEAYRIGGHSRLVWRWMNRDRASSSVVLTQTELAPPPALPEAAARNGGLVYNLAHASPTLLGRAMHLRRLARQYDAVVLHVHPFDVIPALAFGEGWTGPPVIFKNHADHCFWIGLGCTNVVSEHRALGWAVTAELRGVDAAHQDLLPLAIDPLPEGPDRESARRSLGISDTTVLAVSSAIWSKSMPLRGPGLAEVLEPVALRNKDFAAAIVGPAVGDPRWSRVSLVTGGRVQSMGQLDDPTLLLRAADIYVDSTPVGSGTAILEAADAGLPNVSLSRFTGLAAVLCSSAPGLERGHIDVDTPEAFTEVLSALVADAELRRETGAEARRSVREHHSGTGWADGLDRLYAAAGVAPKIRSSAPLPDPKHYDDYSELLLEFHQVSMTMDLQAVMNHHIRVISAETAAWASGAVSAAPGPMAQPASPPQPPAGISSPETDSGSDDRGVSLVAAGGWMADPGWLSATVAATIDAVANVPGAGDRGVRLVLDLEERGPEHVDAAVAMATAVLTDLGHDPGDLPLEIVIGDDEATEAPGYPWRRVALDSSAAPSPAWVRDQVGAPSGTDG